MESVISQHYLISKAVISADRFTDRGSNTIDVTAIVAELDITESAARPYVTGRILLVDDSGLLRSTKMVGSERITITIQPAYTNGGKAITRTFIMRGTDAVSESRSYVFDLIEEHGYQSSAKVINKAYTGRLDDILANIVTGTLKKKLKMLYKDDLADSSANSQPTHVVVPNLTPWQTFTWLVDRMTTQSGIPWFTCGSLYQEDVNLWSLEKALKSEPFNLKFPFIKSTTFANQVNSSQYENTIEADTLIHDHSEGKTDSMHALDRANSINGIYDLIDTAHNLVDQFRFKVEDTLQRLEEMELIQGQDVIDNHFRINDEYITETPSCTLSQASSSGTYLKGNSYSDDPTDADKLNKLSNRMMKNIMMQKSMTVTVSGKLFAATKAGVGRKVRLIFESPDRASDLETPGIDDKISGDYIITGLTHKFTGSQYFIKMDVVKFHRNPAEMTYGQ